MKTLQLITAILALFYIICFTITENPKDGIWAVLMMQLAYGTN